ncbi:MAG: hypothetical protein HQ567_18760 [Candidatus Nealsonbacteria bacterium]|nr:hypothetical protein [Candidatus Nealsonbacteria bacterium]
MQFSLRRLLLVFPAFFLAVAIVTLWDSSVLVTPHYYRAHMRMQAVCYDLKYAENQYGEGNPPEDVISQWLAGRLPANSRFADGLGEPPGCDRWGNPYRFVRNVRSPDGQHMAIGVYSTGHDGVSRTGGNDPDDINSWDADSMEYYVQERQLRDRVSRTTRGAILTPFIFAVMLACPAFVRSLRRSKTQPQPQDTAETTPAPRD